MKRIFAVLSGDPDGAGRPLRRTPGHRRTSARAPSPRLSRRPAAMPRRSRCLSRVSITGRSSAPTPARSTSICWKSIRRWPSTASSFFREQGYYNNTTFHRVIQDFMAQGGDPTATGTGGPGYSFDDEFVGFLNFDRPGWLAMANSGANTNGSQFFITTVPYPSLNYNYTIFGEVLEGQENVANIRLRDPDTATEPGTNAQHRRDHHRSCDRQDNLRSARRRDARRHQHGARHGEQPASSCADARHRAYGHFRRPIRLRRSRPTPCAAITPLSSRSIITSFASAHRLTNAQCDMQTPFRIWRSATRWIASTRLTMPPPRLQDGFLTADGNRQRLHRDRTSTELDYPLYTQTRKQPATQTRPTPSLSGSAGISSSRRRRSSRPAAKRRRIAGCAIWSASRLMRIFSATCCAAKCARSRPASQANKKRRK